MWGLDRRIKLAKRARLALLAVAVALLIAPTGASAATTVGETFTPASDCLGLQTRVQSTSPAGQYSAQSDGVITRWSFEADAAPPDLKFKAARSAGGNDFTVIGESGVESPNPSKLNSFFTRIPVLTGDIIGFYNATPGKCVTNQTGYTYHALLNIDVPPGDAETFSANTGEKLDVSALLEPDCDKDGFGDETQDNDISTCGPGPGPGAAQPPTCRGKLLNIVGTAGPDRIAGTAAADVIDAQGGNDTVTALGANDVVCGGPGKDTLKGGGGADSLLGQAGKDTLKGGAGKDLCKGGKGKDTANCEVEKSI